MSDSLGRAAGANKTYDRILHAAADLASLEGLERITIGRLAQELAMSKSGLFAHFGSKEELHLAVIEAARVRYFNCVIKPAMEAACGLARLETLCQKGVEYLAAPEFPGGCFFVMTRAEFHMRPGPVRDAVMINKRWWRKLVVDTATDALAQGEFAPGTDVEQLAFELEAVLDLPSWSVGDERLPVELRHVRQAVEKMLAGARAPAHSHASNGKRSRQKGRV